MSVIENSEAGRMKENTNVEKQSLGLCDYWIYVKNNHRALESRADPKLRGKKHRSMDKSHKYLWQTYH